MFIVVLVNHPLLRFPFTHCGKAPNFHHTPPVSLHSYFAPSVRSYRARIPHTTLARNDCGTGLTRPLSDSVEPLTDWRYRLPQCAGQRDTWRRMALRFRKSMGLLPGQNMVLRGSWVSPSITVRACRATNPFKTTPLTTQGSVVS
jgi:hypothetical protein